MTKPKAHTPLTSARPGGRSSLRDPKLFDPIRALTKLAVGEQVRLSPAMCTALLAREINVSEAFTLVDAQGVFFRASLKTMTELGGDAVVYEQMSGSTESKARITLVCAVLGRQRMITVVQKATELGCVRITPVLSEHSVKPTDLEREKPWAWHGQALKGARQCRRASVPVVDQVQPLEKLLLSDIWTKAQARFVLDDREGVAAYTFERSTDESARDYVLAVGPEGGWSDREREGLLAANAVPLALGIRVLRAETAVFAGLSVLQHRLGDLR